MWRQLSGSASHLDYRDTAAVFVSSLSSILRSVCGLGNACMGV